MERHLRDVARVWGLALLLAGAGLVLGGLGGAAEAATLYVANNGVDSPTCGAAGSPCRSISRAIQNAAPGDKIVVGPGRYGDLDRSGTFTPATGEEAAEVGSGCLCMIKVTKPLTIESSAGAGATVLDSGGVPLTVVRIEASGVILGRAKKGFTLTGGLMGVAVDAGTSGVRVAGNHASANGGNGFSVDGSGHPLTGNLAVGNSANGFFFDGTGHVLTGNLAIANGSTGFYFHGTGHVLTGNVATANNNPGFFFDGTGHTLVGNQAVSNNGVGFGVGGTGHVVSGNAAQGNQNSGIHVLGGAAATIGQNNLSGNDQVSNCGLTNMSGAPLSAANNFWGAVNGPGADPADNVCNSGAGSSTTTVPFATKPFKLKTKPLF